MISKFFIERPVLANVLAILMVVIGLVALYRLPVAQYPNVTPPTVQVSTRYPGASARTVIDTVALPIEQQVNGVEGMLYMQSYAAADGTYSLTVTFNIGTDLNFAQVLVQNRVSAALSSLPQSVQVQGVVVQKKSTAILEIVTLTSPDNSRDSLYLSNYATIRLKDEIARLPGVGNVTVFGAGQYSMRIWLDPDKLKTRSLTPQDVVQSLQQQSSQVTAGQIGAPPTPDNQAFQYTLNVLGRLDDPEQFANVIVKTGKAGEITRVRDIGRVELGAQTYSQVFSQDNQPAAGMALFPTPGANALSVAAAVEKKMKALSTEFPPGVTYAVPFDTTKFVNESIHEVYKTLYEAAILVLVVILVFLQDWRAMLVPATTVPVTIIGAFAAMAAMDFTVNLSTLFAIILAIGIVVDDAIVVVEGAAHNIERGMSGHDAAIRAMDQLVGPIIGITLVLMSVFLPAAFLPGLTGRMYAQFALVIAATALLSAINAVTLKPTQSAMWLRRPKPLDQRNFFYRGFNAVYLRVENAYACLVGRMAGYSMVMVAIALGVVALSGYGFTRIATGFLPIEDQGYLLAAVQLPDGASLERTQKVMQRVTEIAKKTPGVERVVTIAGVSALDNSSALANAGVAYIILKEWSARGAAEGLLPLFTGLNRSMEDIEEARILVLPPPPIQGVGNAAGVTMQIELRDGSFDLGKLQNVLGSVESNAESQSSIQKVMAPFRSTVPQYTVEVDRSKIETLGLTVDQVFSALAGYLGSAYVDQFTKFGRTFQIYVQADAQYRLRLTDIENLNVRNKDGNMIPLGTVIKITPSVGASLLSLYNLYPSGTLVAVPQRGVSTGQTIDLLEQLAAKTLPPGTGYEWTAMSYQEKLVGGQMFIVFALALLLVYLVLAGQYESWYAPASVILAVPLSLLGPVSVLTALKIDNNLYVQIGLVLLIALSAKNAILIVEVARELRHEGKTILDAAVEAARARFRPIVMTSFAFILGVCRWFWRPAQAPAPASRSASPCSPACSPRRCSPYCSSRRSSWSCSVSRNGASRTSSRPTPARRRRSNSGGGHARRMFVRGSPDRVKRDRAGVGRELSGPRHQGDRAVRAGFARRRGRARHHPAHPDPPRPEHGDREQAGRRHHDRAEGGDGRAGRRLHATLHRAEPGLHAGALSEHELRSVEEPHAGRKRGELFACHGGGARSPCENRQGVGRPHQGQSRQGDVRLRPCHHAAHAGRDIPARHRHGLRRHPVSRRRAGPRRPARRPHRYQRRADLEPDRHHSGRPRQAACLHRPAAQPGSARRADHDRGRLSGGRLPSGRLARIPGAARHTRPGGAADQRRCR